MRYKDIFERHDESYIGYHGTLTANVDRIKREGLKSGDNTVVYLARTEADALAWARALHGNDASISVLTVRHTRRTDGPVIQVHGSIPPQDIIDVRDF